MGVTLEKCERTGSEHFIFNRHRQGKDFQAAASVNVGEREEQQHNVLQKGRGGGGGGQREKV